MTQFLLLTDHCCLKLKGSGVSGHVPDIISKFLAPRTQRIGVADCFSNFTDVESGVLQGSVLGPSLLFFLQVICGMGTLKLSMQMTLFCIRSSRQRRAQVATGLLGDISKINFWCTQQV